MTEQPSSGAGERIPNVLLALAAAGLAGTALFAIAWYRAKTAEVRLQDLSVEDRQRLLEETESVVPGVYVNAWYEPRIGYTFPPGASVELPYDTFVANDLGYRTGKAAKAPGTFRVVFVGDSWTFGHGVHADESFPAVFERLARETHPGQDVEAWNLALSGYNTVNELAALWTFAGRLEPDAVVICPTTNDNDSANFVLPNGSITRLGKLADELGDPHSVNYNSIGVDSYRYRERWRNVFDQLHGTEIHLRELSIPVMFFFVAQWPESFVHRFVAESGLESPYVVNPWEFRTGQWIDPRYAHGTAAANAVYGRIAYQALARVLGWETLPAAGDASDAELFRAPPAGDWQDDSDRILADLTERFIEESFAPPQATPKQCVGPMSCRTGRMGRATTVLVRRREGARRLTIELARIPEARDLYPLAMTVSIPSPSGGTRTRTTVPAAGDVHRFTAEIPEDVAPGAALDVVFEAERVTLVGEGHVAGSVSIRSIRQD